MWRPADIGRKQIINGDSMRFIYQMQEIPKDFSLYIYGAGNGGRHVLGLLNRYRKDISVAGFIDTHKKGEYAGLTVYGIDEAVQTVPDCILIASTFWSEIEDTVKARNIDRYLIVHPDILSDAICFSEEELVRLEPRLQLARDILSSEQDRELFDLVVAGHSAAQESVRIFYDYYTDNLNRIASQYTQFINRDAIATIIDGGVYDGADIITFLGTMLHINKIYGFEPFYSEFEKQLYSAFLEREERVDILPLVLGEKSEKILFHVNSDGQSRVVCGETEDAVDRLEAISIDDFVREKQISNVDFIKLDVEGSELAVLKGAAATLINHRPQIAVCLYHKKEDLFEIPLFLKNKLKDYVFRLGHYRPTFRETVLYAIPLELYLAG